MTNELVAAFGSLVFGGLMLGRVIAGFVSDRLGDRLLVRAGIAVELLGIAMVLVPAKGYILAAAGFVIIGAGMGPVYPACQHMAPASFGKKYSAAVIGLQMASAAAGCTFMPMVFGQIQQRAGIGVMPVYLLIFAVLNITLLEASYRMNKTQPGASDEF